MVNRAKAPQRLKEFLRAAFPAALLMAGGVRTLRAQQEQQGPGIGLPIRPASELRIASPSFPTAPERLVLPLPGGWRGGLSSSVSSVGGVALEEQPVPSGVESGGRESGALTGSLPAVKAAMPARHELGAWVGFSLHSGHYLGYEKHVKWVPLNLRYSYRFWTHEAFALRYAPELTVLTLLDEQSFYSTDPSVRRRTLGGGVTPAGFEMDFYPRKRVQPFVNEHSGVDYFAQRVLSPEGSQLLFETDLGLGINFFSRDRRQDVTVAYRYQHLSNANISNRNPGTDANTFYFGFSRFWTKGAH